MKMLGTERCLVMSSRASWIAAPSSVGGMLVIVFVVAGYECQHTDLVKLKDVGLCAHLAEEALRGLAVGAVRLGEDSYRWSSVSGVSLRMPSMDGIHSPTALLSMISCALVLAAMIVFGLAERAPLKKLRMKLMVGESGVDDDCGGGGGMQAIMS